LVASVGFIGVGVMGREMVRNLLKAHHRVRVFDDYDRLADQGRMP
jgi:2-hydroxy-3-oxopropionate reductase